MDTKGEQGTHPRATQASLAIKTTTQRDRHSRRSKTTSTSERSRNGHRERTASDAAVRCVAGVAAGASLPKQREGPATVGGGGGIADAARGAVFSGPAGRGDHRLPHGGAPAFSISHHREAPGVLGVEVAARGDVSGTIFWGSTQQKYARKLLQGGGGDRGLIMARTSRGAACHSPARCTNPSLHRFTTGTLLFPRKKNIL